MTGTIYSRRSNWKIESNNAVLPLPDTAQCAAVRIAGLHHSLMIQGGDDSIWGMGFRTQGDGED